MRFSFLFAPNGKGNVRVRVFVDGRDAGTLRFSEKEWDSFRTTFEANGRVMPDTDQQTDEERSSSVLDAMGF